MRMAKGGHMVIGGTRRRGEGQFSRKRSLPLIRTIINDIYKILLLSLSSSL